MDDPSRFCTAMETWADAAATPLESDSQAARERRDQFGHHWQIIYGAIRKSCLLDRLMYGQEKLRTRPCPVHHGRWSGITSPPCEHCGVGPTCQCNTGWLPEG